MGYAMISIKYLVAGYEKGRSGRNEYHDNSRTSAVKFYHTKLTNLMG